MTLGPESHIKLPPLCSTSSTAMYFKVIKHVCLFQQKIAAGGNPVFELENVGLKAAMDLLKSSSSDVTETAITDSMSKFRQWSYSTFKCAPTQVHIDF